MAYSVGYRINDEPNGDTVSEAFSKVNAETERVYGILNELKGNDVTPSELEELKTGNILGGRVIGTVAGNIDGSHITGNIPAWMVLGALTQSTIAAGKVSGLTEFVNEIIDDGGGSGSPDKGDGITQSSLTSNGYVKFGNGLILQWGIAYPSINAAEYNVTFGKSFATECYVVIVSGSTAGVIVGRTLSTTGFTVSMAAAGTNGTKVSYIAIGV